MTKKQNRREHVRRLRAVLKRLLQKGDDGPAQVRRGIHKTGYRSGVSRGDFGRE